MTTLLPALRTLTLARRDELIGAVQQAQGTVQDLSDLLEAAMKELRPFGQQETYLRGFVANAVGHVDSTYQLLEWAIESLRAAVE